MINIQPLSQQDPRWANSKLGTSNVTIGGYGCVLTCLAMMAGVNDVNEANRKMIDNGGFVNGSLTHWINAAKAFPRLKFQWRSWVYDNNQVKEWVYTKKYPVIVQVDAAPIGAPRSDHYVLFIGDQKLADPWTGKIEPTSKYPALKGYILYEVSQAVQPPPPPQTLEEKVKAIIWSNDSEALKVARLQQLLPR